MWGGRLRVLYLQRIFWRSVEPKVSLRQATLINFVRINYRDPGANYISHHRFVGNRTSAVEIGLPTSGCGVRSEPRPEGGLELSVRMVIQMDEKLRQQSDKEKIVRCTLPDDLMNMNVGLQDDKKNFR